MCTGVKTTSSQPDSIAMNSGTLEDLKLQLKRNLKSINLILYVSHIREALKTKGVSTEDLCSDLLTMPATSLAEQDLTLLSAHKAELKKATILNDIFDLLVTEYASFLNYEIFQYIVEKYEIDHGEVLQYPEHLKAYLMKHKVSEFVESTPRKTLDPDATSIELVLKIDITLNSKISRILDLKISIAEILGINPTALQLCDITQGCVVVMFLIPTPVANLLFHKHTALGHSQIKL